MLVGVGEWVSVWVGMLRPMRTSMVEVDWEVWVFNRQCSVLNFPREQVRPPEEDRLGVLDQMAIICNNTTTVAGRLVLLLQSKAGLL
jgi:uncharacterized membrane protein YagU involved in acid resistance